MIQIKGMYALVKYIFYVMYILLQYFKQFST
jgi:hypothetical protein